MISLNNNKNFNNSKWMNRLLPVKEYNNQKMNLVYKKKTFKKD